MNDYSAFGNLSFGKGVRSIFACLLIVWVGKVWSLDEAGHVVILANANDPESVEIANHYAGKRNIPAVNIIALPMPDKETISLREYVEFLHNPLLNVLIQKEWVHAVKAKEWDFTGRERVSVGLHRISYLVTIRGVPLRIANDPEQIDPSLSTVPDQFRVSNASVDSELALLIGPENLSMTAFVPNPLFENAGPAMVRPERVIRVSRLDGPDVDSIHRMINRTLTAEAEGLAGRAYFDTGGPHALGDKWIRSSSELARNAYFDTDCETTNRSMDETDRFDMPAIYMGWYQQHAYGPWIQPGWPVPPGAIGFHLHSFSAATVRSVSNGWLGAFIKQGYCATVGNVYEPYLEYTHRPDILLRALLAGRTFGEAVMLSNPVLSWQGVAIGDPLYRPFKVDLNTQLQRTENKPSRAYVFLRAINRLEAKGEADKSLMFAQARYEDEPSLPLIDKLVRLYIKCGKQEKAIKVLKTLRSVDVFAVDEVILAKGLADLLGELGERRDALSLYKKLIHRKGLSTAQQIALLGDGAELAHNANVEKLFLEWTTRAEDLDSGKGASD